jgi:hypothetical protein
MMVGCGAKGGQRSMEGTVRITEELSQLRDTIMIHAGGG